MNSELEYVIVKKNPESRKSASIELRVSDGTVGIRALATVEIIRIYKSHYKRSNKYFIKGKSKQKTTNLENGNPTSKLYGF